MWTRNISRAICLTAICCLPLLLYGAKGALESNTNNVLDWLPSSFDETARLVWFVERFGSDEVLAVSWSDCTLDDERLDRVAAGLLDVADGQPPRKLFRAVYTGRQTLDQLTGSPLELPRDEAGARMRGWLVGPDGRTTCAVALVSKDGEMDRHAALAHVRRVAQASGIPADDLRLAGPTADVVAIDKASQQWIIELGLLSALVGLAAAWVCLRQARLVALLAFSAVFAWASSMSLVYFRAVNMDAVLLMMPALVFVLAVSGGIHLSQHYRESLRHAPASQAPRLAVQRAWVPCTLAAVTTAIGMASLAFSQVTPIRKFGVFSALGVLATLFSLLVLWPSAAQWWLPKPAEQATKRHQRPNPASRALWRGLFQFTQRRWKVVLLAGICVLPFFAWGVSQVRTSVQLRDLLPSHSRSIHDYLWLEEHIGPPVPVEIVLRFPNSGQSNAQVMFQRAELVERVRQRVAELDDVGSTIAATTFAPPLNQGGGARKVMMRLIVGARLAKHRDELARLHFLVDDEQEELWRISARVASLKTDYGEFLRKLQREIDGALAAESSDRAPPPSVICGGVPLVYMAQEQLLKDLIRSFLTAFLLIAVVMMLLMRGILAGLIAMIPNVFPALIAFGTLGLVGAPVDIGTMMTASVAMGIAVDDTLHFLVWFRRGTRRGLGRKRAMGYAFKHCAGPMMQTSIICGLGILVFLISSFPPIRRFSLMMAALLLLALVGDLVLMPALLASPLGHFFVSSRGAHGLRQQNRPRHDPIACHAEGLE